MAGSLPETAKEAVLVKSADVAFLKEKVVGYDWNLGINYSELFNTYIHSGFQATNLGLAIQEVNKMLDCRKQSLTNTVTQDDDPFITVKYNCTIFLGYTSNIISSGLRDTIRFLVQHKLVSEYLCNVQNIHNIVFRMGHIQTNFPSDKENKPFHYHCYLVFFIFS